MERESILVVDDEISFRLFLKTLIETNGYAAVLAKNGEEGIRLASDSPPSLIILDVMMPREGGVAMYRRLKSDERLRDIPVIMLSAVKCRTFGHALRMLGAAGDDLPGPFAYVEKPPNPDEMLGLIQRALAGRGGVKQNAKAGGEIHGV